MPIQKSKVTIFDVAKASGVSSSAVSYALNGKSGVSDVTRDKVLKVAHELGWKPNGAAQALAKAKTQRVGLVLGYDPKLLSVESYMMELISGLGAELEKYDYSLLVRMAVGEDAKLSIIDDWIATGNVDAMLLVNVELGDPCVALLEEHEEMPVLAIADASVVGNLPSLSSADADAVRRAVRYLYDLGASSDRPRRRSRIACALVYSRFRLCGRRFRAGHALSLPAHRLHAGNRSRGHEAPAGVL